jgi:DNA topoisomerase-1
LDVVLQASPHYLFRVSGSQVRFTGFLAVYEEVKDEDIPPAEDEGRVLPSLDEGEPLDLLQLLPRQHFTQPPPRYTEASLVRSLEEYGIGRPSTYAPTISTLQARHFVTRRDRRLFPTDVGTVVNDLLVNHFGEYINVDFTADMEAQLDQVASGDREWGGMIDAFYAPFAGTVEQARDEMPEVIMGNNATGESCPKCGESLIFKYGRHGPFIACSNYPACRHSKSIEVLTGAKCPECGADLVERQTRRGRRFYGCAAYDPDDETSCRFRSWKRPLPQPCLDCGGLLIEAKGGQAQCHSCENEYARDALPPPPPAQEVEDKPKPAIVYVSVT